MNLQKMTSKIDMDVLEEIIEGLQGKMTEPGEGRPFKKKAAVVMDLEPEESALELPGEESEDEEGGEESMEDLLALFHKLKG